MSSILNVGTDGVGSARAGDGGRLTPERWATVVASLLAVRAGGGSVSSAVARTATRLGVSRSTVWAHLARGDDQQRPCHRYRLSEVDRRALLACAGNVSAVARASADGPGVRTMQRAVVAELNELERCYATGGWRAARELGLFRKLDVPRRNVEWQADHKQLGVTVVLPDGTTGKPWLTSFLDAATRVVMGWAVDVRPTESTVTCALRQALLSTPFPERAGLPAGEFGGVPAIIRLDNGLEFAAAAVEAACAELDIEPVRCPPYTPYRKGRVERWHRSLDQMLLAQLPFFDSGPRKADGSLYAGVGSMLTMAELVTAVQGWIDGYQDRPHEGLGGATPRQAWLADPTPTRAVPAEQLRGLLHRERRTLGKYGIRIRGVWYLPPQLYGVRRRVEVRFDKHAPTEVLVYLDGAYADTAFPQHTLTAEQVEQFRVAKRAVVDRLRRDRAAVTRTARLRIRPMTHAGEPEPVAVLPADTPISPARHPSENPAARARAVTSLRPELTEPDP